MDPADELRSALDVFTVLDGLSAVIERRADLMDLVGGSSSANEARNRLRAEWGLTEVQAAAVLDLQVRRFAGLERERIDAERDSVARRIAELENRPDA